MQQFEFQFSGTICAYKRYQVQLGNESKFYLALLNNFTIPLKSKTMR